LENLKIILEQQIADLNTNKGKLESELAKEKSKLNEANADKAKLVNQINELKKDNNQLNENIGKLEVQLKEFISLQIKHENEFKEVKENLTKTENNEKNLQPISGMVLLSQLQKALETKLDETEKNVISINENLVSSFKLEIEKLKLKANNAEKEKRKLDNELKEAIQKINELNNINIKLAEEKIQLENCLNDLKKNQ
jgi:chromosome segregation ATPase